LPIEWRSELLTTHYPPPAPGRGIVKVDSPEQMVDLIEMFNTQQPLLFQEFVQHSYGTVRGRSRSDFFLMMISPVYWSRFLLISHCRTCAYSSSADASW